MRPRLDAKVVAFLFKKKKNFGIEIGNARGSFRFSGGEKVAGRKVRE